MKQAFQHYQNNIERIFNDGSDAYNEIQGVEKLNPKWLTEMMKNMMIQAETFKIACDINDADPLIKANQVPLQM